MTTLLLGATVVGGAYYAYNRYYGSSDQGDNGNQTASSPSLYNRIYGYWNGEPAKAEEPEPITVTKPKNNQGILTRIYNAVVGFFKWIGEKIFGKSSEASDVERGALSEQVEKQKEFLFPPSVPKNIDLKPNYKEMIGTIEDKRDHVLDVIEASLPGNGAMCRRIADCLFPKAHLIQNITYDEKLGAFQFKLKGKLKAKITKVDTDGISSFSTLGIKLSALKSATLESGQDTINLRIVNSAFVFGDKEMKVNLPFVGGVDVLGLFPFAKDAKGSNGEPGVRLVGTPVGKANPTWDQFSMETFERVFPNAVWEIV